MTTANKSRALLVDPVACVTTEVTLTDPNDWRQIAAFVQSEFLDAAYLQFAGDSHAIFVDDLGLAKDNPSFFKLIGDHNEQRILAGRGLVMQFDRRTGECSSTAQAIPDLPVEFITTAQALAALNEQYGPRFF